MTSPTTPYGAPHPDQEFPAKHAAPELSPRAEQWLLTFQACEDEMKPAATYRWDGDGEWLAGQELLDAGLVARIIHQDGRVTYRLTAAGKAWRAAC